MGEELADWEGWGTDDKGHDVHLVCLQCTAEGAAAQVVARTLAKYGARTELTGWRFWLSGYPLFHRKKPLHFRCDENGRPTFLDSDGPG